MKKTIEIELSEESADAMKQAVLSLQSPSVGSAKGIDLGAFAKGEMSTDLMCKVVKACADIENPDLIDRMSVGDLMIAFEEAAVFFEPSQGRKIRRSWE